MNVLADYGVLNDPIKLKDRQRDLSPIVALLPRILSRTAQTPFLVDVFHVLAASTISDNNLDSAKTNQLKSGVLEAQGISGGFLPIANPSREWEVHPRIYSTYYGLKTLELTNDLDSFLQSNYDWQLRTVSWLKTCEVSTGPGRIMFVEPDCPTSISPENCWWGIKILKILRQETVKHLEEQVAKWLIEEYLVTWRHRWSATKTFYVTRLLAEVRAALPSTTNKQLVEFLNTLSKGPGFIEFPQNVKDKFREEGMQASVNPHSTVYALLALRSLGVPMLWQQVRGAISLFSQDGYTAKLRIKDYDYSSGPYAAELFLQMLVVLASD